MPVAPSAFPAAATQGWGLEDDDLDELVLIPKLAF
jgi:hypothetical protein